MSQAEIKRFLADLNAKPALLSGLKAKAAGLASVVAYAAASGYSFSVADARAYMRGISLKALSDAHIDHLAGGKGNPQQGGGQPSDPGFVSPPIYPDGQPPPPMPPISIGIVIVAAGAVTVR